MDQTNETLKTVIQNAQEAVQAALMSIQELWFNQLMKETTEDLKCVAESSAFFKGGGGYRIFYQSPCWTNRNNCMLIKWHCFQAEGVAVPKKSPPVGGHWWVSRKGTEAPVGGFKRHRVGAGTKSGPEAGSGGGRSCGYRACVAGPVWLLCQSVWSRWLLHVRGESIVG
uniref:Uncharacterized protein n=1 Tax=Hyaloperonospora arabidopsidis (strain Emoy2) TaxID=559515 RepID=M4BFV8_HYAAE